MNAISHNPEAVELNSREQRPRYKISHHSTLKAKALRKLNDS